MSFKEQLLAEWTRLDRAAPNEITAWDALVSLLDDKVDAFVLALKADLVVIEHVVSGYSARSTARILSMPVKSVLEVIRIWSLREPPDETLDFNPLLVYNEGMTEDSFEQEIELFLPIMPSREEIQRIIWNIERYRDLIEFLEEVDA